MPDFELSDEMGIKIKEGKVFIYPGIVIILTENVTQKIDGA